PASAASGSTSTPSAAACTGTSERPDTSGNKGRRETLQQLERSHRDGERGGKQPAQDEDRPPGRGQRWVGPRQGAEELPLLSLAQPVPHVHSRVFVTRASSI